jgi:hypothetical protein
VAASGIDTAYRPAAPRRNRSTRRTPSWLDAGKPLGLTCRIADQGESCNEPVQLESVEVGGMCDTQMRRCQACTDPGLSRDLQ